MLAVKKAMIVAAKRKSLMMYTDVMISLVLPILPIALAIYFVAVNPKPNVISRSKYMTKVWIRVNNPKACTPKTLNR